MNYWETDPQSPPLTTYIDRSALDKDLLIRKKALDNKIPLNEDADWELAYIIECYKQTNVDILSLV